MRRRVILKNKRKLQQRRMQNSNLKRRLESQHKGKHSG